MSTSKSRANSGKRGTVGGSRGGGNVQAVFIGGVIAVVLSFVVLFVVAADAFSSDDKPSSVAPDSTATATVEAGATSPPAAVATEPPTAPPTQPPTRGPDGTIEIACGDILAPLDKEHRLPSTCAPGDLVSVPRGQLMRAEAAAAMNEMFAAAAQAGFSLYVNSGYRSYDLQVVTFNGAVQSSGLEYASRSSARPGHSEHQLGTTGDVGARGLELESFVGTPEAAWLLANSYKFGFIVSYQEGTEQITGYMWEPWHVRYVGKAVAQQVKDSGLTLHEFLLK